MLSRRLFLLSGAALVAAADPIAAKAAPKHAKAARPGAQPAPEAAEAAAAPGAAPAQTPIGPVDTAARYALIVDFNTGATLLDKDADVPMVPSSMTKLMTAYIVYSMLKAGRLKLDQTLPVS